MTNETLLPGLGGKMPTPAQSRRAGFAKALDAMNAVHRGYAKTCGLGHPEPTPAIHERGGALLADPKFPDRVSEFLAAQFATRILATRANMELQARQALAHGTYRKSDMTEVEKFCAAAAGRLVEVHLRLFEGFDILGETVPTRAVQVYGAEAAAMAFQAMYDEAGEGTEAFGEWDEAEFWEGFFRGIADGDPTGFLVRGFSAIYLDHTEEFRKALDDDAATVMRSKLRVVNQQA